VVGLVLAGVAGALIGAAVAVWLVGRPRPERRRRAGAGSQLQRAILDSLQDGVVVYDEHERIVFFNPAAEEILGVPRDELLSGVRTWAPLRADGTPMDQEERPVARTMTTGKPCVDVDVGLRHADGSLHWTTVSTRALHERPAENGRFAVVVAFTDITERREATEALERTNAELAQFAYVASHDLSEPLRMVSSYLQLLRRRYHGQIDEDADEFIDFAVEGANRMRALIEDLLAYSRAGGRSDPRPVDCGLVMADVLSSLAAAVADARAQVHVGSLPMVLGDRVSLAQLMQNLLANALKFRRGPGARVWVTSKRDGPSMWQLTVADDGIGIDPRHRDRVFKMFQRLHDREAFEGTGIGLAICRKIVERHGGRIWVEGREGGGTVFRFTLPAVPAPAAVEHAPDSPARASSPVG
jgi:PAS domain S-box-containing protein